MSDFYKNYSQGKTYIELTYSYNQANSALTLQRI